MGYVRISSRPASRYGHRGARTAMGDIASDIMRIRSEVIDADNQDQVRCLNQANASTAVQQIDARIANLAATWQPTGLYTGADITKMIDTIDDATKRARAVLVGLPQDAYGITNARNYLDINDARVATYRKAVATSGGKKIPAPNFKKDVLKSLVNVSNAYVTADVITCRLTWGQQALAIIDRAYQVAKSIVGTILELGESAARAVIGSFNIIGWLGKYPYIPVGIAAVLLYTKFKQK